MLQSRPLHFVNEPTVGPAITMEMYSLTTVSEKRMLLNLMAILDNFPQSLHY